jgi:hypothetical protein
VCQVYVEPTSVAVYDWNGDGRDDLAVATQQSDALTVLLGTGRTACPAFAGHYRLGHRPFNVSLLRRNGVPSPAVVAASELGVQILPFRTAQASLERTALTR